MKNVVLIGFMGTGKTSAGRILANRLGYAFVDVDQKIEAAHKMSIKEMFARHGEDYFRSCEKDMVKKLAAHFLQKAVLGFKVGIESASSYIGAVNNVLDGDFRVGLF